MAGVSKLTTGAHTPILGGSVRGIIALYYAHHQLRSISTPLWCGVSRVPTRIARTLYKRAIILFRAPLFISRRPVVQSIKPYLPASLFLSLKAAQPRPLCLTEKGFQPLSHFWVWKSNCLVLFGEYKTKLILERRNRPSRKNFGFD